MSKIEKKKIILQEIKLIIENFIKQYKKLYIIIESVIIINYTENRMFMKIIV